MGLKRRRPSTGPDLSSRPPKNPASSSLLLVTLLLSSSVESDLALRELTPLQQTSLSHPSLDNLWYSSPNETAIPHCVREYG